MKLKRKKISNKKSEYSPGCRKESSGQGQLQLSTLSKESRTWKLLIVDDEPGIHEVTRLALKGFTFDGKQLELVSAYSANEAYRILEKDQSFSAALIDVVMETEEAGLELVRSIRDTLKLTHIRLIIRTGQPGLAPEKFVIDNYDIDDYKEKTDLTALKIYTMSRSSIKSFNDILTIEKSRAELEQKVKERTKELHEANRELMEISLTDALTNLPNRRHAMQQLRKHWEESLKMPKPLSVMMIDADHFKEVNDTYGHDAGDKVLCELSKVLQHNVRTDDLVCRMGGDEFFILCPNTDISGCLHVAEELRRNVTQMRVRTGDGVWVGSVSIGCAIRQKEMKTIDELIKAADKGVYAAKRAGKNCVRNQQGVVGC